MIENSFVIFPGVTSVTEWGMWEAGISSWDDADVADAKTGGFSSELLDEFRRALARRDAKTFDRSLPPSQRWRLYPNFIDDAAFLDIETTGLSPEHSVVTLVGVLDASGYTSYLRNDNLHELPDALAERRLVITFNGAAFDLPFLRKTFALDDRDDLFDHMAHIDLMFPLRQAGYTGGLKRIEQRLAVGRSNDLSTLGGRDAVTLWHLADTGEEGAMETLIRYNAEDVASLPDLAQIAYDELSDALPIELPPAPRRHWVDTADFPYDPEIVSRVTGR